MIYTIAGGPRYDPNQTDDERHSFENLILLCSFHHDVVDNQAEMYSVDWRQLQRPGEH